MIFLRISALVSKNRSNQKSKGNSLTNWGLFNIVGMIKFFLFNLFLEARAEILEIFGMFFSRFEDTKKTWTMSDAVKYKGIEL